MEKTMTVDVYAISGDFVTCSDCGKVMLLPHGADKCPACKKEGCLAWTDDSLREADIDSLLERHCNLHQEKDPQPEEYLSLAVLATEYIPYLVGKPQTARETLALLLDTGTLFEKYWRNTRCFRSENIYTPAINALLDKLDGKLEKRKQEIVVLNRFISDLTAMKELPVEFSGELWNAFVEKLTIHPDGGAEFLFRNGAAITENI